MELLQYFVFDNSGNNILEASVIECDNARDMATTVIGNYHNSKEMEGLGLVLYDTTNGELLYDSKQERK